MFDEAPRINISVVSSSFIPLLDCSPAYPNMSHVREGGWVVGWPGKWCVVYGGPASRPRQDRQASDYCNPAYHTTLDAGLQVVTRDESIEVRRPIRDGHVD